MLDQATDRAAVPANELLENGMALHALVCDAADGRANRIVTIDIASGATHEYVYDNQIGTKACKP